MVVNPLLLGRRVQVNGVDVTSALNGDQWLSLNRPKITEDGLFPASGTLILLPVSGYPADFFNPRKNRTQWLQGNPVIIEMDVDGNGLERWFTGFLLQRPATPTDNGAALELSIGDELVLRNTDVPAGDRAQVKLGNQTTRTGIIGNIVQASGWVGSWVGSIPEYPIAYPLPKHQGSYVQQMGAIAASAGYGLYCDRLGNLTAAKFTLMPAPLVTRAYANLPQLRPVDGSDAPAPKVQANVAGLSVEPSPRTDSFVITEQGIVAVSYEPISNGLSITGVSGPNILRGIKKRTTFNEQWSESYKTLTERTTVELPTIDFTDDSVVLEVQEVKEVISQYSLDKTGKLQTKETSVYRGTKYAGQAGLIAEQGGENQPIRISRQLESWTYDGEVPSSQTVENYGLSVDTITSLQRGVSFFSEERLSSTVVTKWEPLNGDRWRKTESTFLPSLEVGDDEGESLEGTTTISVGTQYRPSEPERHIPTHTTEVIDYIGCAEFAGVATEEAEVPNFDFEYGVSEAQAKALAEFHGALLIGRDAGWLCQMELSTEWLNWTPASAVQLTLPDGTIGLFLVEGVNIACSENQAFVTFSCVELGTLGTEIYQRYVGQILDGAPTSQPPPVTTSTALIPPYTPVTFGRLGGRGGFRAIADPSSAPPTLKGRLGGKGGMTGDTPVGIDGGRSGGRGGVKSSVI